MSETEIQTAKHESPIQRILVESALIVFSILLALGVNSYVEARRERTLTERTLRGVRDEIITNLHEIQSLRPYHDTLAKQIQQIDVAHQATSYVNFRAHASAWRGLHNPLLDGTAWQSAVTLGTVANMGYDTVRVLSSLYSLQNKFESYMSNSIPTFDLSDAAMTATVRRMSVFLETMGINEDTLSARYAVALKLLGAH